MYERDKIDNNLGINNIGVICEEIGRNPFLPEETWKIVECRPDNNNRYWYGLVLVQDNRCTLTIEGEELVTKFLKKDENNSNK